MSLFGKTIVVNGGITKDVKALFVAMAEAIAERFRENEAEIALLRSEIERLKREPRKTVAQRARERSCL